MNEERNEVVEAQKRMLLSPSDEAHNEPTWFYVEAEELPFHIPRD